jgi:hypothetical protein
MPWFLCPCWSMNPESVYYLFLRIWKYLKTSFLFVGPCDRDYHLGSNFWKFYLIRTGFPVVEPVSLVKVFKLFRLEWIFFGVQIVDTVGRCTTSYLLAGPACSWCLVFLPNCCNRFDLGCTVSELPMCLWWVIYHRSLSVCVFGFHQSRAVLTITLCKWLFLDSSPARCMVGFTHDDQMSHEWEKSIPWGKDLGNHFWPPTSRNSSGKGDFCSL